VPWTTSSAWCCCGPTATTWRPATGSAEAIAGPGDRHDPLPSFARLPAFLWRKLPRLGRILVALLALAGLAAVIASIPGVREARRGNAERERRERAAAAQRRAQRERELVRPRRVAGVHSTAALERAIAADVLSRERRRPLRVRCRALGGGRFSCLAVTAEARPSRGNRGVKIGFPYRARADFAAGRAALCRALGQPGEGAFARRSAAANPVACGG